MRLNNKTIPYLNFINVKTSPYGSKVILRHNNYRSDIKLGPGIFEIRIMPYNFRACATIISLYWDKKIKEAFNHTRYGRVYSCKYSQKQFVTITGL